MDILKVYVLLCLLVKVKEIFCCNVAEKKQVKTRKQRNYGHCVSFLSSEPLKICSAIFVSVTSWGEPLWWSTDQSWQSAVLYLVVVIHIKMVFLCSVSQKTRTLINYGTDLCLHPERIGWRIPPIPQFAHIILLRIRLSKMMFTHH